MDQATTVPCWVRGSRIEEMIWIGKDILAWCTGLYIVFFHTVKRRQTLRWCWNHATGDGAHRMSGHVSSSIFAFSERRLNPRIFVIAYPAMTKLCECTEGCASEYLAIAFTADEYLVSLGSYPSFQLIVWRWRTGEKIATADTLVRDEIGQLIKISAAGRTVIGQMGKTCGRLCTWQLDIVKDVAILEDHEVKLPGEATIHGIDWCPTSCDPLLAITDRDGHIYLSNHDGTDIRRIVLSQRCGICAHAEMPAICWFRGGIVLRTTFCQIRYFVEVPGTDGWRKEWYVKSICKPYILIAHPLKTDSVFYYTLEGYLMQIRFSANANAPSIHRHLHYGGGYRYVDFLYPWCHHLVVTDDLKELTILERYSGSEVSKISLDAEGFITDLISHPHYPLAVVVSDQGEMIMLGVTDPERPKLLARFRLQRQPLDLMKFTESGRFLIAAQKATGNGYCISLKCDDRPWRVMAQLRMRRSITDLLLYETPRGDLKALALYTTSERLLVGHQLLVYEVSQVDRPIDKVNAVVTLPGYFRNLCHAPEDPRLLIVSPYLQRHLHVLKLHEWKDVALTDAAFTGHHTRLARVFADRRWITTCAFDGLVVVRDKTIHRVVIVAPAHHRLDSGGLKAIVNPEGDTVIVLGHNGSLVAMRAHNAGKKKNEASAPMVQTESVYLVDYEWYEKQKEKIVSDYASLDPAIRTSLTQVTPKCPANDDGSTWEEWWRDTQLRKEIETRVDEKAGIMKDLTGLRATVRQLLDANEICPKIERLPVSAFDLDKAGRDQKLKIAKDEREDVRMKLEHLCVSMDRIGDWIKATFWVPQAVLGRSIFSFQGVTEVTNYPLAQEDPYFKDNLRWAQFNRESVRNILDDDTFQPWRAYTDRQLQVELNKPIKIHREDDKYKIDTFLEEEEQRMETENLTETRAFDGMTTHRFLEQSPYYYSQMESYGLQHVMLENHYLMHDCSKLRAYFNELFDSMYAMKEREMNAIRQRRERISYIDSELQIMFGQSVSRILADPQWRPKERVEGIIQVHDHEVKAKPYISPSQQDILDRQAADAEELRRLLLADDFRERAIMKMMNGVLEIRWEDIIKIDVRQPACMVKKVPEEYTPEDILAVKKYEADVEILREERERYKRMLEADYAKISGLLQEGMAKYDAKLHEFFQVKLKVEAAINQLKLRHIRGRLRNFQRIVTLGEDDGMKGEISRKRRYGAIVEKRLEKLHGAYHDTLGRYDALCAYERTMAKRFPQEFVPLSKVSIEFLAQQYKRRPRMSLRNIAASDLIDLGKVLVGHSEPIYLTSECTDYMDSLNNLDTRPSGTPESIDEIHWDRLIRLRRQKIETELSIRACRLEITAAEQTIAVFESKIEACRSDVDLMEDQLRRTREERMTREQNAEVQLVLKMGQVEIELQGERRDTTDAILVPRSEIGRVNGHILGAGSRKLNALRRTFDFRHGTLSFEWEHRCLRTTAKESREDLHFLRDLMVTRDMRTYLKRRAKGLRDDKTAARLEKQVETTKRSLGKALTKETTKLENVRRRIVAVRKMNAELDESINRMNVVRWEMEYRRDLNLETRQRRHADRKMRLFKQRCETVGKLQRNYAELSELQTQLELLQLRTRPTLGYLRTLDDKEDGALMATEEFGD